MRQNTLEKQYVIRDGLARKVESFICGHPMFEVAFRGAKLTKKLEKQFRNEKTQILSKVCKYANREKV